MFREPRVFFNALLNMIWRLFIPLLLMAGLAGGDIVYLDDGRELQGRATRTGQTVRLIRPDGKVMTFPADSVLYIATGPVDTSTTRPSEPLDEPAPLPPATSPDNSLPTPSRAPPPAAPPPPPGTGTVSFEASSASRPESLVFMLLRQAIGQANRPENLQRQLAYYRGLAHERRRRVGRDWLYPRDFARRRKGFADLLAQAGQHLSPLRRLDRERFEELSRREQLEVTRHKAAGVRLLDQAAAAWADPPLKHFLLGVSELNNGEATVAYERFDDALTDQPQVALFHQGRGMALAELDRPLDALDDLSTMVRLRPGDEEGVELLRRILTAVPGSRIDQPACTQAKSLAEQFARPRRSRSRRDDETHWLFPGDTVDADRFTLPTPPMDRLDILAAVAVPVAEQVLLVDAAIVRGASDLAVQVDADTLTAARGRTRRRRQPQPLALLGVEDHSFTPLVPVKDEQITVGLTATAWTTNRLAEMGAALRRQPVTVTAVGPDAQITLSATLLPGESAGPVITDDGRLLGVLAGWDDPFADKPNARLYRGEDLSDLLAKASRARIRNRSRQVTPSPTSGQTFLVWSVHGERFESAEK